MKKLGLLLLAFMLSACASDYKPFEFTPIDEIPPGPGVFTGEDGEWVIYRKKGEP